MSTANEMDLGDIRPESSLQKSNTLTGFKSRLQKLWSRLSKRQKMTGGLVLGIITTASLGVLAAQTLTGHGSSSQIDSGNPLPGEKPTPQASISLPELNEPKDQTNPLNGNPMTKSAYQAAQKYQPIWVMIENHPASRPQFGLSQADLVYETLAEGGITRFMALFWENAPEKVGPVRSMRKYFLDIASEYPEAPIMHIGQASTDNSETDAWGYIAKNALKSLPVVVSGLFWRETQPGLALEHTAFSSIPQLREKSQSVGWGIGPPDATLSWRFGQNIPRKERTPQQRIQVNWGGWEVPTFQVVWQYDAETNSYHRSYADGTLALDASANKQIQAKTVLVQFTRQPPAQNEVDGKPRLINQIIGQGQALVFQNGEVIEASWEKPARTSRTRFTNAVGEEIAFVPGPIWVAVVPENSLIEY